MSVQDDNGNYIVVARRYRPQAFDELIGQSHVAQALTNAIKTNRVGHAYLFTGARGVGKTSAARILAKALNCPNGEPGKPCQECNVCKDIASGEDVDVLEIDGASNRGIDEIRQLRSNVNIRPGRADFKVYIIDEVHMLTMQAFNALLKTLEEPPEHVKFIFCTTDPEKIPITVLSRCQRFDFASVESAAIRGRLEHICKEENVQADADALGILARRAAGSMRDSQSLLEQLLSFCGDKLSVEDVQKLLGTADTGRVIQLAQTIADRQPGEAMVAVDAAIHSGVDAGQLTEQLLICWRDVAAILVGCGDELLQFARPDDVPVLKELGTRCGLESTLSVLQILDSTLSRMRLSTHMRTLLEIAIVRAASLQSVESLTNMLRTASDSAGNASVSTEKKKPEPASLNTQSRSNAVAASVAAPATASTADPVASREPDSESVANATAGSENSASEIGQRSTPVAAKNDSLQAAATTVAPVTSPVGSPDSKSDKATESASSASAASLPDSNRAALVAVAASPLKTTATARTAGDSGSQGSTHQQQSSIVRESVQHEKSATAADSVAEAQKPPVNLNERNARSIWASVLDEMGDMTAEFARSYQKVMVAENNQLVVTLESAYNKDECERGNRKVRFEETLSRIVGQPTRVVFRVDEKQAVARPRVEQKTKRQLIREVEKYPMVAEAVTLFDGEIVDINMPRKKS